MNVALTGAASNVCFRAGKLVHLLSVTMQMSELDNECFEKTGGAPWEQSQRRRSGRPAAGRLPAAAQLPRIHPSPLPAAADLRMD